VLLRLAYLGVANAFAMLRLLPLTDRAKDAEILALRHQIMVLERQLGGQRVRFAAADRALLAALLHAFPAGALGRMRLLVRPGTVLRWHRDLLARRHAAASRPKQRGRPPAHTVDPVTGAAIGAGEPRLGIPADPRRVADTWSSGGGVHRVGDPA